MTTIRYKIMPDCAFEYFKSETPTALVVCATPGSRAMVLSGTGTLIWDALTREFQTESDIVIAISEQAGVSPDVISDDVRETLTSLHESGLIEQG